MKRPFLIRVFVVSLFLVGVSLLLSACGALGGRGNSRTTAQQAIASTKRAQSTSKAAQKPTDGGAAITATATATMTPTPVPTSPVENLKVAAEAYCRLLLAKDADALAQQYSTYSLTLTAAKREELADRLLAGWAKDGAVSACVVGKATVVSETGALVDVRLSYADVKASNHTWAFYYEDGRWRPNWQNVIDQRRVYLQDVPREGVSVKLLRMVRYSDHLDLVLMVRNNTDQTVVWGGGSAPKLTTWIGGVGEDFKGKAEIFLAQQSYPELTVSFDGWFKQYPEKVDLRYFHTAKWEKTWKYTLEVVKPLTTD